MSFKYDKYKHRVPLLHFTLGFTLGSGRISGWLKIANFPYPLILPPRSGWPLSNL